ncbi:MAG: hypothetical protein ACRCXZ_06515 [Patescibacteria group bacterium]
MENGQREFYVARYIVIQNGLASLSKNRRPENKHLLPTDYKTNDDGVKYTYQISGDQTSLQVMQGTGPIASMDKKEILGYVQTNLAKFDLT